MSIDTMAIYGILLQMQKSLSLCFEPQTHNLPLSQLKCKVNAFFQFNLYFCVNILLYSCKKDVLLLKWD